MSSGKEQANMKTVIAIDLGATNLRLALIDELGQILKKEQSTTPLQDDLVQNIQEKIQKLLTANEIKKTIGVGVSIAGFIDQKKGILIKSPNLPFKNLEIVKPLKDYFKKIVILNNDANAAATGEKYWGQAKNINDFLYLTISSGIGGTAFVDNKLVLDKNGNGIEPGHIQIENNYNLPCGCGGKNHWESYSSGINLPRFLKAWAEKNKIKIDFDGSDVFTIFDAIKNKNETAVKFFDQVMEINLQGINYLIRSYHPKLIILGGGVYLHNLELFNKFLPEKPLFKPASFGKDASIIGAAAFLFCSK
jgi:glucokinase